jgi:uncharacterized membrane protein
MFGLIIATISFIIADSEHFGGDMIYALSILKNWYYFNFGLLLIIASVVAAFIYISIMPQQIASKLELVGSYLAKTTVSLVVICLIMARILIQIMLVNWLITDINPMVDDLNTKQILATLLLCLLAIYPNSNNG